MKILPTLEGGLRIDAEAEDDWELLRCILTDANGCQTDLANRLGGMISEEAGAEDWQEYIVPDLREAFQDELAQVGANIESAAHQAHGGPGPLWITREDGLQWYSSLNQARLALEDYFQFGVTELVDLDALTEEAKFAFIRSQFYCEIQGMLLEYVIE